MGIVLKEVIIKALEGAEIERLSNSETAAWILIEVTKALNENGIDMRETELGALEYAS